jgi:hypothetical protein
MSGPKGAPRATGRAAAWTKERRGPAATGGQTGKEAGQERPEARGEIHHDRGR